MNIEVLRKWSDKYPRSFKLLGCLAILIVVPLIVGYFMLPKSEQGTQAAASIQVSSTPTPGL